MRECSSDLPIGSRNSAANPGIGLQKLPDRCEAKSLLGKLFEYAQAASVRITR